MPRLSKIRLTGCRYEGLQKEHENSIFDLTKDGKADHSLFTLCNGGGKGVMMQLIFQILLPKTRWGKNNGNKVISMFYDIRNNLHPFTFHVVLEWVLDTVPEKRLITGIAVKGTIKNTSDDDENKTGLSYFLYTHEHEGEGYFTVENLPLYDKKTNEAVDIDVLDDFIRDNRRDFIRYSKSSASRSDSDYYTYLENRGIYRGEWLNLKAINKSEGGAGDYFTGAGDNKSIFDKIIIPAISENIRNYSFDGGDDLLEMFRSNLSITKDLPILIKREGDYKELLVAIRPLIQNTLIGSKLVDIKERLIGEGNDIYFVLKDESIFVDKEIEKWEAEFKKTKQGKKDLEYKKDNLYYNKHNRNVELKGKEARNLSEKLEELGIEIRDKKEEELLYKINKSLYYRKKVEKDIESKTIEKEKLLEALDIVDIRLRAEKLDKEIELEWDKIKDIWVDIENQYSAFINYTNGIKDTNQDKKKKYLSKIENLEKQDNIFLIKEEDLFNIKQSLEEIYDPLSLSFPERITEDLIDLQDELEEETASLSEAKENYIKQISKLDIETVKWDYELKSKVKDIKSLNNELIKQESLELDISRKIAKQLMENVEGGLLSHDWFNKKLAELRKLKAEKNTSLESIQRAIWEKNIGKLLNKEDYFIANKDIELIKEEIKRIDINVQTGAEYLNEIEEKEKKEILESNPGFIYSLVIASENDWEIIYRNISEDLLINNMVPIYIRSQMKTYKDDSFKLIKNQAYELIDKDAYLDWKYKMENSISSLIQTKTNIEEDLSNINEIIQEIEIISLKDTAIILTQKLKLENDRKVEILEELRRIKEEKLNIENKVNNIGNELKENKDELAKNNIHIGQINEYIKKIEEVEKERKVILEVRKEIGKLKKDILNLDEESGNISSNQDLIKDSYWEWKAQIKNVITNVKEIYKDFSYDYQVNEKYSNYRTPNFILGDGRLESLVGERKVIEKDISAKDTSIAVLDTEIKNLAKDRSRYLKELENHSRNWNKYEYLNIPLDEINIKVGNLGRSIENLEKEEVKTKSELDSISGNIEIMKEQLVEIETDILKAHGRVAVVIEIEDIRSEFNIVQRDIESNKKYLSLCEEVLEKNTKKKMKLEINLSKIKTGYPIEIGKGKTDKILKDKLEENPDLIVDEWLSKCENNKGKLHETIEDGERLRNRFIKEAEHKLEENRLRNKITSTIKEVVISNFKKNEDSFRGMEQNFESEILRSSKDKEKAEKAMEQWTDRASMHVIKMIDSLKNMVNSMNYINEQGHAFPLVKLKGIERLPKEKSEIIYLLEEYFIQSILKVLEKGNDISNISDRELKDLMGDKEIFSKALQGRYPVLMVYKMSEKNEFRYARARDEYYTTWEAINKGEGDLPEGSGGQTLSVNTFVIMMIMSFKKKHIGNENPSTVLILDNPFGKASAKHVLDPIFEIADRLNFQLICFAAPEIIKVEISERFPVFWELKIEDGKVVHGGRVIK